MPTASRLRRLSREGFRLAVIRLDCRLLPLAKEFRVTRGTIARIARLHGFSFHKRLGFYTPQEVEEIVIRFRTCGAAARFFRVGTVTLKAYAEERGIPNDWTAYGQLSRVHRLSADVVQRILAASGRKRVAAETLGVSLSTLERFMREHGITTPNGRRLSDRVIEIRRLADSGVPRAEIATRLGLTRRYIAGALRHRTKTWLPEPPPEEMSDEAWAAEPMELDTKLKPVVTQDPQGGRRGADAR